jgi:hypothetical protein
VIVIMELNAQGMRLASSTIVISSGFDPRANPAAANGPITAAMSGALATLSGRRISAPNAAYAMTFANVPLGSYPFFCVLQRGLGMTGKRK